MKRGKIDKRYSSDVIAALWTDEVERLQKDAAYMKTRRLSRHDPAEFLAYNYPDHMGATAKAVKVVEPGGPPRKVHYARMFDVSFQPLATII